MVDRSTWKAINKIRDRLRMRISGLVTRAKIAASVVTGNGQIVGVLMLEGEERDGAEYFDTFGVASAPPPGSEGIAIAVGGSRDQVVVVCASPKGGTPEGRETGEVDFYGLLKQRMRMHLLGDVSIEPVAGRVVYIGSTVNPALPFVARGGDTVVMSAELALWVSNVTAVLNVVPGTITPIAGPNSGAVVASSKTTKVG